MYISPQQWYGQLCLATTWYPQVYSHCAKGDNDPTTNTQEQHPWLTLTPNSMMAINKKLRQCKEYRSQLDTQKATKQGLTSWRVTWHQKVQGQIVQIQHPSMEWLDTSILLSLVLLPPNILFSYHLIKNLFNQMGNGHQNAH